jgi:hypothetical protein
MKGKKPSRGEGTRSRRTRALLRRGRGSDLPRLVRLGEGRGRSLRARGTWERGSELLRMIWGEDLRSYPPLESEVFPHATHPFLSSHSPTRLSSPIRAGFSVSAQTDPHHRTRPTGSHDRSQPSTPRASERLSGSRRRWKTSCLDEVDLEQVP